MQVPMLDLGPQYAALHDDVMAAVEAVVKDLGFCNGPPVRELEKEVARACGCAEAVGVSSGTDALLMSLMALEIGAGQGGGGQAGADEVITTPFTFFATAGSIWRAGARPVFVDIDPETFNIDPARIEAAVTDRTKAIMPVHLYGQMAEMDAIMDVAARHRLPVIEDAAQSIGATYKGRKACATGTMGCLSFYPSKNLSAPGDAGMVLTQDAELAARLRALRNHGQGGTYVHKWVGGNFRMDSICAAALGVKLPHLDGWSKSRAGHAAMYDELLADVEAVTTPAVADHCSSVYNLYVIRAERRDELRAYLNDHGISSGVYYPLCLHQQECFQFLGYKAGDFPVSETAAAEVLALPVYPELTDRQIQYVAAKIAEFFG